MHKRKDYCGPYWMPSFLRKLMSHKFNASCKIHDMDYESKKYSRQDADIRFLTHCIKQAKGRFLWEVVGCLYFLMVRMGGHLSWKKDGKTSKH